MRKDNFLWPRLSAAGGQITPDSTEQLPNQFPQKRHRRRSRSLSEHQAAKRSTSVPSPWCHQHYDGGRSIHRHAVMAEGATSALTTRAGGGMGGGVSDVGAV